MKTEKRIKMSVGEAIIRFLDTQYISFDGVEGKFVEGIYTVFGHGCVLGVGEALANGEHSLKVYQGKNEQGMAHAAHAYAKEHNRRKILPCLTSIGPGSANMVTAAAAATINHVPLLLLLGDTYATRRPDPVLQQVEQEYDLTLSTNDCFKPVVRYFDRISRPEMLESALKNALRTLTDPEKAGAVALALPQDVQGEVYDFPAALFQKRVTRIGRAVPEPEDVAAAVKLIKKAKKPLLVVGGGARYSEAGDAIVALCQQCNLPLAETQNGKSVVPSSFGGNLGGLGVTGNLAANRIAQEADLIVGIGTRFSDFTTASKTLFGAAKAVITMNLSRFDGDKLDAKVALKADAKQAVLALTKKLAGYQSGYQNEILDAKAAWQAEYARLSRIKVGDLPEVRAMTPTTQQDFLAAVGGAMCQTTALAIVREEIEADAVVVAAAGSLPGCMQRMWETDAPNTYNMEYGYSCMGYEIAGAFGAKLAKPNQAVYAMTGDGSYLMLHSEMVTAVQEGVKICVLLFDNGGFGCINNLQMGKGCNSLATEFRKNAKANTPYLAIDYAQNAKSYGLAAYTAKTEDELRQALRLAKEETGAVLIDIKVLPKSMTDGYEGGFWQVGLTNAPRNEAQTAALAEQKQKIKR